MLIDDPKAVADRYLDLNFGAVSESGERQPGAPVRAGAGAAPVVDAWMEDQYGNRKSTLPQSGPCTFRAVVQFERAVDDPSFAVAFVNPQRQNVFVASTATRSEATGRFDGGETATFSVSFANALAPGRYALSAVGSITLWRICSRIAASGFSMISSWTFLFGTVSIT
jgi:hypothetical protein